ncbi:MAG: hypothetical protein ACREKS_24030, partial [Candidatus Rokuibacteriota bacterium]
MVRVIESASSAQRVEAARAFLAALPAAEGALVVGATRTAADDLVRWVTATAGATFGIHRMSLTQLAAQVAAPEMARLGTAPASALGAEAVAARVIFEALSAGALGYFAPVARFPGFARAVASTLGELRLAQISPEALGATCTPTASGQGASHASQDVAELLTRFDAVLGTGALADRRALFELALSALSADPPPAIARVPLVLL